jgi:hypothetical protein
MKSIFSTFVLTLALFLVSCDKTVVSPDQVPANTYDTLSSKFQRPITAIISGPSEGQQISSSSVSFAWSGGKSVASYFYCFDAGAWTATTVTSVTLDDLDEGPHKFQLKGLHFNGVIEEAIPQQRSFIVNAVVGPAVMFVPRRLSVKLNQDFTYDIWAEEVSSMLGCKLVLSYDASFLTISSMSAGNFLRANNGEPGAFPETIDKATGRATVELAVLGGNPRGVSGSGPIVTLACKALRTGTTQIYFSNVETTMRDANNVAIVLRDYVSGKLVITQ